MDSLKRIEELSAENQMLKMRVQDLLTIIEMSQRFGRVMSPDYEKILKAKGALK